MKIMKVTFHQCNTDKPLNRECWLSAGAGCLSGKILLIAFAAILYSGCQLEEMDVIPMSGYCQPDVDSFRADYPWFPLDNAPPLKLTAAGQIKQINDTAAAKGWTAANNLIGILDLHCSRAYSFCPRGEFDSVQHQLWSAMNIVQMVAEVNRVDEEESIGYYRGSTFNRWLASSGATGGQAVLDHIEDKGFTRNLMNWWMITPNTNHPAVQSFLDSLIPPAASTAKAPGIACGGITRFNNMLLNANYYGIYTADLNFGDEGLTHTVSLWQINNSILYYDALNGLTLAKPNGDTIDFRSAFEHIYHGRYDSVEFRILPQYFGPDYAMTSAAELRGLITDLNLDYTSMLQGWQAYNFNYSFDSSWFCRQ